MDFRTEESFLNDKEFKSESRRMFIALLDKPLTRYEVAKLINVDRANICRYVSCLLQNGRIAITRIRKCSISGDGNVEELTTNKDLFPEDNQTYFDFLD
jgi:DNA-binding transcriptional regulator LsrR (DeoR family)